jgi:hypothetical protein
MITQYCKFTVDLPGKRIVQYIEFIDDWANRQVEQYPDKQEWFFCGDESSMKDKLRMCDRPLSRLKIKEEHMIERHEFEEAWEKAKWKFHHNMERSNSPTTARS